MAPPKISPEIRFYQKIDMLPDSCWIWLASLWPDGYGKFVPFHNGSMRAHRWSYEYHIGPIPEDLLVLHECDVKECVNPDHLFLGTHKDNMKDRNNKNRQVQGENVNTAKLIADEVKEIRLLYKNNMCTQKDLSSEFGVTPAMISSIIRRKSWKSI